VAQARAKGLVRPKSGHLGGNGIGRRSVDYGRSILDDLLDSWLGRDDECCAAGEGLKRLEPETLVNCGLYT
jgi:hypothetical protein